jgi:hypothetical protein
LHDDRRKAAIANTVYKSSRQSLNYFLLNWSAGALYILALAASILNSMDFKKLTPTDFNQLDGSVDNETTNRNHIIFGFYDFDVHPDKITDSLDLKPTKTGLKGEEYEVGGQKKIRKTRDCNFWEIELKTLTNDFIGDLVDKFVNDFIKDRIKEIKMFSDNCQCKLTVVQYYRDSWNPGYFFSRDLVRLLADINAEIDIDTYCLGEDKSVSR